MISSILGMNLFGCKFCEIIDGDKICDRKNFDSLLWALVTVFQVDEVDCHLQIISVYVYINYCLKPKKN